MSSLEQTVAAVRVMTPKLKEEPLMTWFARTYELGERIWKSNHAPLKRVTERDAQSKRLLDAQGPIEPEKEDDDSDE